MATINEISNAAGYTGNAALGGYIPSAIELDTKPVQQLMAYTVMQNKALFEQRQVDAQDKLKQLAEISQFDITRARGKDKDMAIAAMAELQHFAADYARKGVPRNPQEKIQQEIELQTKIKDATDKIKSLNARGIAYQARLAAIEKESGTAETKTAKKRRLDEVFDTTSWDTPIPLEENYKAEIPEISAPMYTKNTTSVDTGNEIVQQEVSFFNPGQNHKAAFAEGAGLMQKLTLPPNATPEQRAEFELRKAAGGETQTFVSAANALNETLANPRYKDANGDLDENALKNDNPIAGGILNLIDRSNEYNRQLGEDIKNGVYVTKLGKKVNLANVVRKEDLVNIDKNKPLTTADILYLKKFSEATPDTKAEKVDFTGEDIREAGLGVDWYNAKTGRINANKPSASAGGGGTALEGSNQTALLFGEHVNRIKIQLAKNPGRVPVIGYDQTDEITRKALGLQKGEYVTYMADGTALVGSNKDGTGGRPLTIEQQKSNFVVAVKGGSKDEAQLDSKFITEQENGMINTFGTTNGTAIWQGWGTPAKSSSPAGPSAPAAGSPKTINRADLAKKAAASGYSPEAYEKLLKSKGIKIL